MEKNILRINIISIMKKSFISSMALAVTLSAGAVSEAEAAPVAAAACCVSDAVEAEEFADFLKRFTTSAAFQLTRVRFPMRTPIVLLEEDGETERTVSFTKEKWPLIDEEVLKAERIVNDDGSVYVSQYTEDTPAKKVFEAGYEESEIDIHIEFELIDGKWFVTDCISGWYGGDMMVSELKDAVRQVAEDNTAFREMYP
jgi:hypothetical protein